jgi:hypothetical protein
MQINLSLILSVLLSVTVIAGCTKVEPWEKRNFATKQMLQGKNRGLNMTEDHTYFSKEGARGGGTSVASGCGCG